MNRFPRMHHPFGVADEYKRDLRGLTVRGKELLDLVDSVFQIKRSSDLQTLNKRIKPENVRAFYEGVEQIWPADTNLNYVLPNISTDLRALYFGDIEPVKIIQNVLRYSLYCDEIYIIDPIFAAFGYPDYSPIDQPGPFLEDTIKLVFFLKSIEGWIRTGLVKLVPNPGNFDPGFHQKSVEEARLRMDAFLNEPGNASLMREDASSILDPDLKRLIVLYPYEQLRSVCKEAAPQLSEEQVRALYDNLQMLRGRDPFLVDPGDGPYHQLLISRQGANLETVLYLCSLIGSFPFTSLRTGWAHLTNAQNRMDEDARVWMPLTRAFAELDFKFLNYIDLDFALDIRGEGRLSGLRAFLRKIWIQALGNKEFTTEATIRDFNDQLIHEYRLAMAEWELITKGWMAPTIAGSILTLAGSAAIPYLNGGLLPLLPAGGFMVKGANELLQSYNKRKEFRLKTPMSVFIDLERTGSERKLILNTLI